MIEFINVKNENFFKLFFSQFIIKYKNTVTTKYVFFPCVILFLCSFMTNAQNFSWADGYGTHNGESTDLVKCDSKGNTYTVGYINGGCSIGDIYINETSRVIIKYNKSGEVIWVKTIVGNNLPYILDLFIDDKDQIYLLGNSSSTISYDDEIINTDATYLSFLLTINEDGELINQKQYNSYLKQIVATDQHIFLLGNFTHYATFNDYHLINNRNKYNSGLYFVKLDKNGNHINSKVFEAGEFNYVNMDISNDGSVYICGNFDGDKLTVDGKVHNCSPNNNNYFITCIDNEANIKWLTIKNTNNGYISPVNMLVDNQGDIYVAGNIIGEFKDLTTQRHDYGTFLFKYSTQGKLLWQRELATNNTIGHTIVGFKGCALDIDNDNSVFIASSFMTNFNIPNYKCEDINVVKTGSSSDIFIAKFHPLGYVQWVKVIGGSKDEWLRDIAIDKDDHINIVGKYASLSLNFDNHIIKNNSGNYDHDAFSACLIDPTGIAPCPILPVNILSAKTNLCRYDTITLTTDYAFINYCQWKKDGSILPYHNDSIIITSKGQYRLIINEGTLCKDSSDNLTIEDRKLPLPKIFYGDSTIICDQDSVVLKVKDFDNSNYEWFKDGSIIESQKDSFIVAKEEGNYSVHMNNEFCAQLDSVFIKKLEYPNITINADTFSYQGIPIDIYPIMNSDSKALWYYNYDIKEFSRENKISTSLLGNYTIVAENYCGIDVDQVFVNEEHNGIKDKYLKDASLILSPNPSNGSFLISLDGFKVGECLIEILNIKGNVVKSFTEWCNNNENKAIPINIATSSGTYFVRITQNSNFIIGKLIIKN